MFAEYALRDPFFFFSWILIIVFSICLHEYAHARVALLKGDDTAARHGHLTLNPMVQMGWSSLIMLALAGIAWGAVPVNPGRMRGRSAHAQVAFAGPAANLLLCLAFALAAALAETFGATREILNFLRMAYMANAVLFLFNMLPLPMFDGWVILSYFVPPLEKINVQNLSAFSWILLVVIWTSGIMSGIWRVGAAVGDTIRGVAVTLLAAAGL